jgi:hypothetical protein
MKRSNSRLLFPLLAALLAASPAPPVRAQEAGKGAADSANEDANNPLAKIQAFNVHDYYIPSLTEGGDDTANTLWLRYAQPIGKVLIRASLPLAKVPTSDGTGSSGLGDFNVLGTYLFDVGPKLSFGVGPQITMPTSTNDQTGSGKWQGGLAAIYFNTRSPVVQWGGLVTWQASFAGDEDRPGTNVLAVQPFFFVQMGKGLYARSAAVMAFNLKDGSYNVPVGVGIGQVIPTASAVFNVFAEPQFTVLSHGPGQPNLQLFVGLNTQFLRK